MAVSAALVVLLIAATAGVGAAARFLHRPIPGRLLAGFFLLAILPFPRAVVSDLTVLPLDHVLYTQPWARPGSPPPYNPYLNDVVTQILPWAKATRMAVREGALPLRNRWNGCGLPLAANGVSAAFSPLTLLSFLLPLARSFTLQAAIKLLLAAAGMWLWTRELGASERAAAFGSVAFALSFSFTPPWLLFPQSAVLCLWPWTLFAVERCRDERGRGRAIASLAAVFVLTELAGHPETAAMGFLFAAIWLVTRWICGDLAKPGRLFAAIALAAAAAVGLTAFLLLPTLFAIAASGRLAAMSRPFWEPIFSLAPHGPQWRCVPTAFFPHTLGNAIGSPRLPGATGSFPETGLGYIGIVGWSAALLILRPGSRRRTVEWVLLGLLLCGIGVSVGQWPLAEIFGRIPVIRLMFPLRFHSWDALAGAAIAALELERYAKDLREGGRARLWAALIPVLLGAVAVLVYLRFRAEHSFVGGLAFQQRQLLVVLSVLALAALLPLAARNRAGLCVAGLTLLCGAELLYQWRGLFHVYPSALLFPETPLIRFLHSQSEPFRVVGEGPTLFPNTNIFARVEDIRTHDAVERRDYLAFLDATCGYPHEGYFKKIRNLDASAMDFLNVRYAVTGPGRKGPGERWRAAYSGPDGALFENSGVLPRAFAPVRVRLVASQASTAEPLSDASSAFGAAFREVASLTDWRGKAYVLSGRDEEIANAPVEVSDYRDTTNTASFRVRVTEGFGPGYVVVSLAHDGGWSARDSSGETVPVLRANGPFLAVALPAGDHRVSLRYSPPGFRAGAAVSGAAAAVVLVLGAAFRARRKRLPIRVAATPPTPSSR